MHNWGQIQKIHVLYEKFNTDLIKTKVQGKTFNQHGITLKYTMHPLTSWSIWKSAECIQSCINSKCITINVLITSYKLQLLYFYNNKK